MPKTQRAGLRLSRETIRSLTAGRAAALQYTYTCPPSTDCQTFGCQFGPEGRAD
jgi:hypothetical protein